MSGLDGVPSQEVNVAVEKTYTEKIRLRSWWKGSEKRDRRCRTRSSSDPSRAKFELDLVDSLGTGGEGAGEQQLQGQHHLQQHCLQQQQSEDCCACCDDEAHAVATATAAAVTTAAATAVFATAAATAVVSTAALPSMLQHPRIARKPNNVVEEHKKRATLVWVVLILAIVGFVIWQIVSLVNKYNNPSTSSKVSDDIFRFPYTEVCFSEGNGCDANFGLSSCINSVWHRVTDHCGELWNVTSESKYTCVAFDLEKVDIDGLEAKCGAAQAKPSIEILMGWTASLDAGSETIFRTRVGVYMGGEDVHEVTWVPYSRLLRSGEANISEASIPLTDLTIGKSVRKFLSGSSIISYPTLTISTTDYINQEWHNFNDNVDGDGADDESRSSSSSGGRDPADGVFLLTITLGRFAQTELSDDNPIDMLNFIANIGGFWEVLLLAWGVFFIATNDTRTRQKARSFDKEIQRGKKFMRMQGPSPPQAVATDAKEGDEEKPNWDIAHGGPIQATGINNADGIPMDESSV